MPPPNDQQAQTPVTNPTSPQPHQGLDFSNIEGHIEHGTVPSQDPMVRSAVLGPNYAQDAADAWNSVREEMRNHQIEHPVLGSIADKMDALQEMLFGGQSVGKPMGTKAGVADEAQFLMGAADAPEMTEAAVNAASKGLGHLAETGGEFVQGLKEEVPQWLAAKAPATGEAGAIPLDFSHIDGHEVIEPADKNYVYHATTADRAQDIANEGLHTHKPWEFTDQSSWPDRATEKRAYFATSPEKAKPFTPEGKPVMLRMEYDPNIHKVESTGDIYTQHPVSNKKLEIQNPDGSWRPITQPAQTLNEDEIKNHVESVGGTFRGINPNGQVEITLPRSMTDKLPIQDRMKDFVSVNVPADQLNPETVKAAMDRKFAEFGGKPEDLQPPTEEKSPIAQLKENFPTTTDPEPILVTGRGSFITPDGQYMPLPDGSEHALVIGRVSKKPGNMPENEWVTKLRDKQNDFMNNQNLIRVRVQKGQEGNNLFITVPKSTLSEDQIQAIRGLVGRNRHGMLTLETADRPNAIKFQQREFASPSDVDVMLHKMGVHPESKK